jgi:hypothetical protein
MLMGPAGPIGVLQVDLGDEKAGHRRPNDRQPGQARRPRGTARPAGPRPMSPPGDARPMRSGPQTALAGRVARRVRRRSCRCRARPPAP